MPPRAGTRLVPRDGAALFFDAASGTNLLVRSEATRGLRARAPRTVMLGLTNACNLRCGFCSRDAAAPSTWTEDTLVAFASDLAAHGVLELALGGGEPLAFRGLERLLARLAAETPLAVHLTTNAVLLDDARLEAIRPWVGDVRVSIYDETPWPERIASLARAGGSFGANVLLTRDRVDELSALLDRLEALGCPDIALLRYVGSDRALALGAEDERRVAEAARRTSMRVRASVCFGHRLGLPSLRTFDADCGAGDEFLVIGTDRTVRGCSFDRSGIPCTSATEAIAIWRSERDRLARAVELLGCARREQSPTTTPRDGAFLWQAFSGNNSGECFLVGKFERSDEALALLARIREQGIELGAGERMPDIVVAVGRSVLGWTGSALEDEFPSLRHLVWAQGGRIVTSGIHVHESVALLTAVHDTRERVEDMGVRAAVEGLGECVRRGDVLFSWRDLRTAPLGRAVDQWRDVAGESGTLAAELVTIDDETPALTRLVRARPSPGEREWLVGHASAEQAARVAADHPEQAAIGAGLVVIGRPNVRAHDGARASRHGSAMSVVRGDTLRLRFFFSHPDSAPMSTAEADRIERDLRAELGHEGAVEGPLAHERVRTWGTLTTREPLRVVPFLDGFARGRGLRLWLDVEPLAPLADAVERLDVDVRALRRERR